jgi:hypothetical protein
MQLSADHPVGITHSHAVRGPALRLQPGTRGGSGRDYGGLGRSVSKRSSGNHSVACSLSCVCRPALQPGRTYLWHASLALAHVLAQPWANLGLRAYFSVYMSTYRQVLASDILACTSTSLGQRLIPVLRGYCCRGMVDSMPPPSIWRTHSYSHV